MAPPFNRELEDFAQAFSTGYNAVKSPQERETEQLTTQRLKFAAERDPITAAQEDTKFGLDVDIAKGKLTDAEIARKRAVVDNAHADALFDLDTRLKNGQLTQQEYDANRKIVDDAHADELHGLTVRKEGALANEAEYKISKPVREQERRKGEALIGQSEAATETSRTTTAGEKIKNEGEQLKLNELKRQDKLHQGLLDGLQRPPPAENQPRVIGGGAQPAPEAVPAAPAGSAPFVYEPPAPSAVGPVNTGNGATFSGAGATRGAVLPAEAVPAEAEPGTAPAVVSDIFAGGVERKPIELTQVADDSTAVETEAGLRKPVGLLQAEDDSTAPVRQRVLDHVASGGGEKMPDGKRVLDVAGKEAVKDGLQQVIRDHGLDQDQAVDTPETEAQHQGYLGGTRAASPETVKMAEDTVEERAGETLSQNEKTYYTLSTTWLYHNGIGDAEGAKNAAASLLQHYQLAFSQYASVAQAASSNGDIDGAMEASVRAYANVPTGDELHLSWTKDHKHIIATITDMDGVTTQKQLMTPEEMGAYAMNVNPSSFVTLIAQAAGREKEGQLSAAFIKAHPEAEGMTLSEYTQDRISRNQATSSAKKTLSGGGKTTTPSDELKTSPIDDEAVTAKEAAVSTAFTNYRAKHDASWLPHLASEEKQRIVDEELIPMTTTIALQNTGKGLTTQNVVQIVTDLTKNRPAKWREIDENTYGVTAKNQPEIKIGKDQFDALTILRGQQEAAGFTSEQAAKDAAAVDAADNAEQQRISEKIAVKGETTAVPVDVGLGGDVYSDPTLYPSLPAQAPLPPLQIPPVVRPPVRRPAQTINMSPFR